MIAAPRTVAPTLETIRRLIESHGGTVPDAAANALDHLEDLRASTLAFLDDLPASNLTAAVVDAIEAGKNPMTDKAVQTALTVAKLHELRTDPAVSEVFAQRATEIAHTHGPSLLTAFTNPFNRAADTLHRSAEHFGNLNVDQVTARADHNPNDAALWVETRQAEDVIRAGDQLWHSLRTIGVLPGVNRNPSLVYADIPPDEYLDNLAILDQQKIRPWDAARRGWHLSLADAATWNARFDALTEARHHRQRTADSAAKNNLGMRLTPTR